MRQNWESNDDPATAPTRRARPARDRPRRVERRPGGVPGRDPADARDADDLLPQPHRGRRATSTSSSSSRRRRRSSRARSPPSRSASVPIEDQGSDFANEDTPLPPETLQDIPIGSMPIGSSRSRASRRTAAAPTRSPRSSPRGETGFYTVAIRGYNGSHSDLPAVLRVKTTPPRRRCRRARRARSRTAPAPRASSPPRLARPTTKTLFLAEPRAAQPPLRAGRHRRDADAALRRCSARPEVAGALLEVDGNAAVRAAYAAWDATPCNIEAANDVVRAINDVVAQYRARLPELRYVVMLGSDEALPMARVQRPVDDLERDATRPATSSSRRRTSRRGTRSTPPPRAKFLTDGPYGAFAQIPWLGRELSCPSSPVSRLVETPRDIKAPARGVRRRERDAHRELRAHDRLRLPHGRRRRGRTARSRRSSAAGTRRG